MSNIDKTAKAPLKELSKLLKLGCRKTKEAVLAALDRASIKPKDYHAIRRAVNDEGKIPLSLLNVIKEILFGIPEREHIIANAVEGISINPKPGIYFLLDGDNIVYVGQSINVTARIGEHTPEKKFNKTFVFYVDKKSLLAIETICINMYSPKYNKTLSRKGKEISLVITGIEAYLPYKFNDKVRKTTMISKSKNEEMIVLKRVNDLFRKQTSEAVVEERALRREVLKKYF